MITSQEYIFSQAKKITHLSRALELACMKLYETMKEKGTTIADDVFIHNLMNHFLKEAENERI